MPGSDPTHWLFRLTSDEWLQAARNELAQAERALRGKQRRQGVTLARRAAGMALNARLARHPDERYGRSYMEHLAALRDDGDAPDEARRAAMSLLEAPLQTDLVALGPGDDRLALDAARIVSWAGSEAAPFSTPGG